MDSNNHAEKKAWVEPTLAIVDVRETLGGIFKQTNEGAYMFAGQTFGLGGPNGSLVITNAPPTSR